MSKTDSTTSFGIGESEESSGNSSKAPFPPPPRTSPAVSSKNTSNDLETAKRLLRTSKNKIEELKAQLQAEQLDTRKIREEFQRFSIRSELDRQQRESEIFKLNEVNLKFKQFNVVSHDVQLEIHSLRNKFELLEKERGDLLQETKRLQERLIEEEEAHAIQLQKYEAKLSPCHPSEERELKSKLDEVKREFLLFQQLSASALEEKDRQLHAARTSSEAQTELQYLRDVCFKYLSSSKEDVQTKASLEEAICTVLKFTPEERRLIREKRAPSSQYYLFY